MPRENADVEPEIEMTDMEAMDAIYVLMSGNEWSSDTLEENNG